MFLTGPRPELAMLLTGPRPELAAFPTGPRSGLTAIPTGPRPGVSQDGPPWRHTGAGEFWFRELQSFDWLRDLNVLYREC